MPLHLQNYDTFLLIPGNAAAPPGMGPRVFGMEIKTIFISVLPLIVLAATHKFAAAMLVYWCSTNLFSLAQVMILNQKPVRKWLNIPELRKPPKDAKPKKRMSISEQWEDFKLSNQVEDRSRLASAQAFAQAASGPLRKTYRTDPTKVKLE